jgi:hypothetical protein
MDDTVTNAGMQGQVVSSITPEAANAAARKAAVAASGAVRLETRANSATKGEEGHLTVHSKGCRCATCERCGPARGWKIRQRLQELGIFRSPVLFTLTVDRTKWATPEEAYRDIKEGGYIWRLMRSIGAEIWFYVVEFQQKSGGGWPHWHIVIEKEDWAGRMPKDVLQTAWRLWRDTWKIGGVDVKSFAGAGEHAINYVTKYLMKQPVKGYPEWVLVSDQRIRFCAASRSVGPLVATVRLETDDDGEEESDEHGEEKSDKHEKRKKSQPLVYRMSECGVYSVVFREKVSQEGDVTLEWCGNLPCSVEFVLERIASGRLSPGRYAAEMVMNADGVLKPSEKIVMSSAKCVDQMLIDLVASGLDEPMLRSWRDSIKFRRTQIIAKAVHDFHREESPDVSDLGWASFVALTCEGQAEISESLDDGIPF